MTIDLAALPTPAVIEPLDYETLFEQKKAKLLAAVPADMRAAIAAALQLDSEPVTMLSQLAAYIELTARQRINDAAKASMLAYAEKTDLDHRAADYGVRRLLVRPADPTTTPPTAAEWETDARLRYRAQMALEGLAAGGPRGAYRFHALSASADVADVDIDSPAPGQVRVWLLGRDGMASQALLDTVAAALNAETIRPLCDTVTTAAATPLAFDIRADITYQPGGEALSGGAAGAAQRLAKMLAARRRIGGGVPRSAIDAALHVDGVERVAIASPAADVLGQVGRYPDCASITVTPA
ncbi:baseplate J/gp47 family protein [Chromobacterium subtsugae]|uniref:baseplate assembly protein n=1 Tax=Chromobacterium subtsugae TaxID=251747 RepID=UPI00064138A5|nr:baseplate J/gp47 family protein [Chromobacterium subtsugae]